MKVAVFVSAGLGDALLLVPLVKELKKGGAQVSGIFTSPFKCEQLFFDTRIFDEIIVPPINSGLAIISSLVKFKKFDAAYLNFFASTRKNFLIAQTISKKIISIKTPLPFKNPVIANSKNIIFIEPQKGIHDATQNLRLLHSKTLDSLLTEEHFRVDFPETFLSQKKFPVLKNLKNKKYFTIQISSGNNIQKYKNWDTEYWCSFIKEAASKYPMHRFLLLGEPREKEIAENILNKKIPRTYSVAGETGIIEAMEFIRKSELFIGLDGGLMHLAVAVSKPTFTLWGPSDSTLYGYEKINPLKHRVVFREISCRPCNSWINPNTSRVQNPMDCPDYICMKNLRPDTVFNEFQYFYNKISLS